MTKPKYKIIQSVARAFSIIDCFDEDHTQLTLNEISKMTGLNINTTRGIVHTLLNYDYLAYDEKMNTFRLGLIFIEKAEIAHFEFTRRIIQLVLKDLQKVADDYAVSIRMLSIESTQASIVTEMKPSRSRYSLTIHDASEFPLYASATGKIILAYLEPSYRDQLIENFDWKQFGKHTHQDAKSLVKDLETIKETAVSIENEELGIGFSSVAVPIFNDDELMYSISVTTTKEILNQHEPALIQVLNQIKEKIEVAMQTSN